jgi:hypothetical protein
MRNKYKYDKSSAVFFSFRSFLATTFIPAIAHLWKGEKMLFLQDVRGVEDKQTLMQAYKKRHKQQRPEN